MRDSGHAGLYGETASSIKSGRETTADSREIVIAADTVICCFPPFSSHADRVNSREQDVTGCEMLAVFFIACPICIAALFGFARHVHPATGQFRR
ncbi:hypothetical protein B0G81_2936 [Paraburkholderia sp. BL6665CI2N2]|nr:hypothetical protein B0G81_2936 [Paraburkholderia sp. BL6665CI2N2]